jgi:hypothetical protein
MNIRDAIQQLEQFAARPGRENAELVLFNRETEETLRVRPDWDIFDFEITDGGDEIVIEFSA